MTLVEMKKTQFGRDGGAPVSATYQESRTMEPKLIYIGRGDSLFLVPARDLTDEDFAERAESWKEIGIDEAVLIASGLYKKPGNEPAPKKSKATKEGE